jgi:hypothetical protein
MLGHQADAGGETDFAGMSGNVGERHERVHPIDRAGRGKGAILRVWILRLGVAIEQDDVLGRPECAEAETLGVFRDRAECARMRGLAQARGQ